MEHRRTRAHAQAGFTLIELLVVLALIGLMAVWGYPALLHTMDRQRLTAAAREASVYMQQARLEAIKRGGQAMVLYQNAATCSIGQPCLIAFVDNDSDYAYTAGTDDLVKGPWPLPNAVKLQGPIDAGPEGGNSIQGWDEGSAPTVDGPVYQSDGSALKTGAFRFTDGRGNFLETRIEFVGTGKIAIQKWFGGGSADANWYENREADHEWQW